MAGTYNPSYKVDVECFPDTAQDMRADIFAIHRLSERRAYVSLL